MTISPWFIYFCNISDDTIKPMKQECLKFLEEIIILLKNKNQELQEELEFKEGLQKMLKLEEGQVLIKLKSEIQLTEDLIYINQNIYNKKLKMLQEAIERDL